MEEKRKKDPKRSRDRILRAAKELFIEKGYEGTSMSQIAGKSGVTQSMIHYYFGSKRGLWDEMKERAFLPLLRERMRTLYAKKEFDDLVRESITHRFRFFQKHPEVVKLLSRTQIMNEAMSHKLGMKIGGMWLEIYRQAQKDELIRGDISPEHIMAIYIALTTHWFQAKHVMSRFEGAQDLDSDEADGRFLEAILKVFMDGLRISRKDRAGAETE